MLGKVAPLSVLIIGLAYYMRSGSETIRDGKVIQTRTGPVKGRISVSRDGRDYYAWYGIPYAKPPLGSLRFSDPLPVDKWKEVIDGRKAGPECAQGNMWHSAPSDIFGSEDCLQLNVFVPKEAHEEAIHGENPKLPVIVYIHGGGYISGSSKSASGSYFMDEDVILVTLNYRLDILGFLTTGDKIARGNQGLKDQTMALKWIKDNIEDFGGDPNQILLFGSSAGGGSVHQHTLSPGSKGLFQSAFVSSGVATAAWGLLPLHRSLEKTKEAAQIFNCPTNDNQALVDCLRNMDLETLLKPRFNSLVNDLFALNPQNHGDAFAPILEPLDDNHAFMREHPLKTISDGKAARVPLLIGHTTREGLMPYAAFVRDPENEAKFEARHIPAIKVIFGIRMPNANETARSIYEYYLHNRKQLTVDERMSKYADMFGDAVFNFDIRETVRIQRKFSPVYYYIHNKTDVPDYFWLSTEITGKWPIMAEAVWYFVKTFVKENIFGIMNPFAGLNHGADLLYYFPFQEFDFSIKKDDERYQYSKDLISLLVQFAKDHTKVMFRNVRISPTPSEGPLKILEFKNDGVIYSREPFRERMEYLRSLSIRP